MVWKICLLPNQADCPICCMSSSKTEHSPTCLKRLDSIGGTTPSPPYLSIWTTMVIRISSCRAWLERFFSKTMGRVDLKRNGFT